MEQATRLLPWSLRLRAFALRVRFTRIRPSWLLPAPSITSVPQCLLHWQESTSPLARNFASSSTPPSSSSTSLLENVNEYNAVADDVLHDLLDKFEDIIESDASRIGAEADVTYSDGVLTVNFGNAGIYVINKQAPNRQIWLSSPISGPKRYAYVDGKWIYSHDGVELFDLLESEISSILGRAANLK